MSYDTHVAKWASRRAFCERMFTKAANGNQAAYVFLFALFECISIADDLQDKDVEHRPDAITRLCYLFSTLLANPFCRAQGDALAALMTTGVLAWDLSNSIERGNDYSKFIYQVVFYVASVCGGYELARELESEWFITPGN